MRNLAPALALAALALLASAACSAAADLAASPLDFSATALDGSEFQGQSLAGKAVLLDFWGTWCAPCVHAFPTLRRLHDDFGDELEIVGLAYYSGDLTDIAAVVAEHGLEYTVAEGKETTLEHFEILAFPSYILISASGQVIYSQAGEAADLYERVSGLLVSARR